jgi:hypothetical protein
MGRGLAETPALLVRYVLLKGRRRGFVGELAKGLERPGASGEAL